VHAQKGAGSHVPLWVNDGDTAAEDNLSLRVKSGLGSFSSLFWLAKRSAQKGGRGGNITAA